MPSLVDVDVFAAPDRLAGEAVAAFVILAADVAASKADVRRYVRERMADSAAPSIVGFVEQLPRNRTGKTDKLELDKRLAAA